MVKFLTGMLTLSQQNSDGTAGNLEERNHPPLQGCTNSPSRGDQRAVRREHTEHPSTAALSSDKIMMMRSSTQMKLLFHLRGWGKCNDHSRTPVDRIRAARETRETSMPRSCQKRDGLWQRHLHAISAACGHRRRRTYRQKKPQPFRA